jgi:uncharacterized membrane protein YkoI
MQSPDGSLVGRSRDQSERDPRRAGGHHRARPERSGADALTRASAAALAEIEGGRVTGTEISDEDSYYEVEITLGDGQQVDVQLDASFHALDSDADVGTTGNAD